MRLDTVTSSMMMCIMSIVQTRQLTPVMVMCDHAEEVCGAEATVHHGDGDHDAERLGGVRHDPLTPLVAPHL